MATMVTEKVRELNTEVLDRVGSFGGHLWLTYQGRLRLELGCDMTYWTHPKLEGRYSSEGSIEQVVIAKHLDPSRTKSWKKDDRLTIRRVADIVERIECAVYGWETDGDMDTKYNIWDEGGIGISSEVRYHELDPMERQLQEYDYWPTDWNYAYVMHGSSEGYYLHVECGYSIYDEHNRQKEFIKHGMLSAKAFGDWEKLCESAARISYLLQWPI